jgi:hypothetical protein
LESAPGTGGPEGGLGRDEEDAMKNPTIPCLVLAMGVCAGLAGAQVAPPPPAEKPEQPEYRPAERPAARPAAQPAERPAPNQARRIDQLPTNIPYPKLAQVGADGRIIRLKELPDVLALRANPTVGPKSVDAIMPVIYGRRARFEMLVIDNLDLLWNLQDGAIETLNMNDLNELSRVAEMIKPLVGKTTLSEELLNRGILSRVQGGMNEHIVREYKQAISDEIQVQEGTDGMMEFMRFILRDSIQEAEIAYYGLLAELRVKAPALLAETGIEAPQLESLDENLSEDPDERDAQVAETDKALRAVGVDDAIKLLTAMREGRQNPNVSPTVVRIDVMHDRKSDQSDSSLGIKGLDGKPEMKTRAPDKGEPGADQPERPEQPDQPQD